MAKLLTFVAEDGLPLVFLNGNALVEDVYVFLEEVIPCARAGDGY